MPTLDADYIRSRVPVVFDAPGVPDFALNEAIAAAQLEVNRDAFGGSADEATFLLACHKAYMNTANKIGGAKSYQADRVKIEYNVGLATSTGFYQQYKELLRRKVLSISVGGCG